MKSGIFKYLLVLLSVFIVLFVFFSAGSCSTADKPPVSSETEPGTELSTPDVAETPEVGTPAPSQDVPPTDAVETPEPVEPTPTPTPEPTVPPTVLPASDPVDDEWFSDAAFLGNSLVDGFRLFSGLTTCDYYAVTSMTIVSSTDMVNLMNQKQYGKIYILLGINEIGYQPEVFKAQYADLLERIREHQPDADIYIMGLSPVSAYRSNTDGLFNMTRVNLYNEQLLALAEETGNYYIDLVEALSDETGYLPSNVTSDGIHFEAVHYQVWLDWLRTHHA